MERGGTERGTEHGSGEIDPEEGKPATEQEEGLGEPDHSLSGRSRESDEPAEAADDEPAASGREPRGRTDLDRP